MAQASSPELYYATPSSTSSPAVSSPSPGLSEDMSQEPKRSLAPTPDATNSLMWEQWPNDSHRTTLRAEIEHQNIEDEAATKEGDLFKSAHASQTQHDEVFDSNPKMPSIINTAPVAASPVIASCSVEKGKRRRTDAQDSDRVQKQVKRSTQNTASPANRTSQSTTATETSFKGPSLPLDSDLRFDTILNDVLKTGPELRVIKRFICGMEITLPENETPTITLPNGVFISVVKSY